MRKTIVLIALIGLVATALVAGCASSNNQQSTSGNSSQIDTNMTVNNSTGSSGNSSYAGNGTVTPTGSGYSG